jgi:hypothetical protein
LQEQGNRARRLGTGIISANRVDCPENVLARTHFAPQRSAPLSAGGGAPGLASEAAAPESALCFCSTRLFRTCSACLTTRSSSVKSGPAEGSRWLHAWARPVACCKQRAVVVAAPTRVSWVACWNAASMVPAVIAFAAPAAPLPSVTGDPFLSGGRVLAATSIARSVTVPNAFETRRGAVRIAWSISR